MSHTGHLARGSILPGLGRLGVSWGLGGLGATPFIVGFVPPKGVSTRAQLTAKVEQFDINSRSRVETFTSSGKIKKPRSGGSDEEEEE